MLQTRTVEPGTLELLKQLMSLKALEQFYLVGGTALALQMGHRISVDLDLFTAVRPTSV
ncbi:nucleotidyl transferase AbiEii/AbiGii toxin family protein [Runella sp.]|uniref:nucleotidyl transferase AbiEii/AbiGii toxin family protein n=1 Tax=Runella sp. TaxID=1960881 RepID=UPI0030189585